ncbi:MAG: GerMN domain-containing protein [Candidatus Pacebacteria bacterium]|nr:GerMN domain-containing protein [Candidatus Paceibacterota bacterium]
MKKFITPLAIAILLAVIVIIIIFTQRAIIRNEEARTEVNVFFGNTVMNPQTEDCKLVYSVKREIKKTPQVAKAAIEELLKGPTDEEKSQGYITGINTGVEIQKLSIEDGTIKIDFNDKLQEGIGGSCLVSMIMSQIVTTLKQFPTVKDVIVSIDGRTDDILQP